MSKGFFGQPAGLSTLFFTEMWERFSYYGMRAILILFMISPQAQDGLGMTRDTAGAIYGLYTAGVYLFTLPGGWLADNILGQRKAIWYGGIMIMIGHLLLAIPGIPIIFFLGLIFVALGTGLLKPNISTIVGDLYPEGGVRRDRGFSIFYMGINTGSFLGQLIVPVLAQWHGWHWGFGAAAVGMFLGLIQFRLTQGNLMDIGIQPKAKEEKDGGQGAGVNRGLAIGVLVLLLAFLGILQAMGKIDMFTAVGFAQAVGIIIASVTLAYFLFVLFAGGLTEEERKRVLVIFCLFIGAALFWSGFEQAGSSLTLFAEDFTILDPLGFKIPAGSVQIFNAIFIVMFAPVVGWLWVRLAARQLNPNTPIKFAIGLVLMGLGFLVMVFAAQIAAQGTDVSMGWLILTYFLHSIGELTLSPVGLSATTKLAPKRYLGQMMGIWFVATSLGNLIAGLLAGGVDPKSPNDMAPLFMSVFIFAAVVGALFLVFSPIIKKWSGNAA
jgi:proton-dependent oligopeptide transporter, POT family